MTRQEIEQLLELLRKFHGMTGVEIVALEVEILNFCKNQPFLQMRDGILYDDKVAAEYDDAYVINDPNKICSSSLSRQAVPSSFWAKVCFPERLMGQSGFFR